MEQKKPKNQLLSFLLFSALFFCLSSCATLSDQIDDLSPRDRKSKVLKILGPPFKIDREDGEDHWIYKFVEDGRHYTKAVVFKDNMLLRTERRKPYPLKRF